METRKRYFKTEFVVGKGQTADSTLKRDVGVEGSQYYLIGRTLNY